MPNINLKLDQEQIDKTTELASRIHLNRSAYIREAIDFFNQKTERELLEEQFRRASAKCRAESLRVCREFENIDQIPE